MHRKCTERDNSDRWFRVKRGVENNSACKIKAFYKMGIRTVYLHY
jgi:hypothetical protein